LGCQLAFYEYWTEQHGGTADIINQGPVPTKYRFLDPDKVVQSPDRRARHKPWDCGVIFECSGLDRTGTVAKLVPDDLPLINIDHHRHIGDFGVVNIVDPTAAACAEMLYDMFRFWKATITTTMAQQLGAAILTDTGRFYHPCTTIRTMEITTRLMRLGANLNTLADRIYYSQSPNQFQLIHHVLGKAELRAGGTICLLALRAKDRKSYGVAMHDLEGLVDYTLSLAGVKVGALLKELGPNKTKASLRSSDAFDVSLVARRFGGGGHKNAAGCIIDLPINKVGDLLVKEIGPLGKRRR
jgi:phosphoesterase RecJ-like protein